MLELRAVRIVRRPKLSQPFVTEMPLSSPPEYDSLNTWLALLSLHVVVIAPWVKVELFPDRS
ncbi:MAG: hypothetical protein ABSG78_13895 [Verrucomicrobiota bacterium]